MPAKDNANRDCRMYCVGS